MDLARHTAEKKTRTISKACPVEGRPYQLYQSGEETATISQTGLLQDENKRSNYILIY